MNNKTNAFEKILKTLGLLPELNESKLFVVTISSLLTLHVYDYGDLVANTSKYPMFLPYVITGIVSYYVLSTRKKSLFEIELIHSFMTTYLFCVSLGLIGMMVDDAATGYWQPALFVWMISKTMLSKFLARRGPYSSQIYSANIQATTKELVAALLIATAVIFTANHLNQHWSIALSTVIFIWSYTEILFSWMDHKPVVIIN